MCLVLTDCAIEHLTSKLVLVIILQNSLYVNLLNFNFVDNNPQSVLLFALITDGDFFCYLKFEMNMYSIA